MNVFKKRIDELGRIVIPKQIRNILKINSFDEIEMFLEKDTIILKKGIGIEIYKNKLDSLLSFASKLIDLKVIITDKNNVISSNYEGVNYRHELVLEPKESSFIDTPKVRGYIEKMPIILDSNNLGNVYFISESKIDKNNELIKQIYNIIIGLIK